MDFIADNRLAISMKSRKTLTNICQIFGFMIQTRERSYHLDSLDQTR